MSFEKIADRILDTLKANENFARMIAEFRFGEEGTGQGKAILGHSYPLCYVSLAPSPEIARDALGPADHIDHIPPQKRTLEYWVILVAKGTTPEEAQREVYKVASKAIEILEKNLTLRTPENKDPLAIYTDLFMQRRLVEQAGSILEAMTIRVRPMIIA